jgi:peptide/nickel transport system permease protein
MKQTSLYLSKLKAAMQRYLRVPVVIILTFVIMAIFAPFLTPYSPTVQNLSARLTSPSAKFPLGTDHMGRDILTRIMFGARTSFVVAFLALALGGTIGLIIGIWSGYSGGRIDAVLMRLTDSMLAFPIIFIALLLAVTLGPSLWNVVVAIGIVVWARYARVIRGEVLTLKERDFVALAKVAGCSPLRIMARDIFPNVLNTFVVMLTLQVGWVILVEATLSFLGAGIPPPNPTWGSMIADGRRYINTAWWVSFFPGIAILLTALSFNLLGDWLREALDPKLRQVRG